MNAASEREKFEKLIDSIHKCYESELKIEVKTNQSHTNPNYDSTNIAIAKLLYERKLAAENYVKTKNKNALYAFEHYNNDIIRFLGLYTT